MKYLLLCLAASLAISQSFTASASAGEQAVKSECGDASIEIKATPSPDSEDVYSKIILVAESQTETARLIFDNGSNALRGAEYFFAACVKGKDQRSYIIFQNYCVDPGCHDRDNYGIIDADSLRVLLVPDDNNHVRASEILGKQPPHLFSYRRKFFPQTGHLEGQIRG